jgi:hypothetical protein
MPGRTVQDVGNYQLIRWARGENTLRHRGVELSD